MTHLRSHCHTKLGVFGTGCRPNLPIDEFRNCLSAFCIISYIKEQFSFSAAELRETVNQALSLEQKKLDYADFINDLVESVCLLQPEGTDYIFTHRSFQEYFAALFISRSPATDLRKLLDQMANRRTDDVIPMAFAMNKHLLEREWIVPKLEYFVTTASQVDPIKDYVGYIDTLFGGMALNIVKGKYRGFNLRETPSDANVWTTFETLYPQPFVSVNRWSQKQEKLSIPMIQAAIDELIAKNDPRLRLGTLSPNPKNFSGELLLIPEDMAWLKRTWVPEYERRYVEAMKKLLTSIKGDAKSQSAILADLLLQPD